MAPPRRHVSPIGEALRAARQSLGLDQTALAQRLWTSARQVSRWENGLRPTPGQAQEILGAFRESSPEVRGMLADALGLELEEVEPPAAAPPPRVEAPPPAPVVAPPPIPEVVVPPPAPSPRPPVAQLRASFDAIILVAAEERDVLPRHLRAFAVELLRGAARLGVSVEEAAELVAVAERSPATPAS